MMGERGTIGFDTNFSKAEYISEDNPEYIQERAEKKRQAQESVGYFGEEIFKDANIDEESVELVMEDLIEAARNGKHGSQEARMLFVEALQKKEILQDSETAKLTRNMPGHPNAPTLLLDAVTNDRMSSRLFLEILKEHRKAFEGSIKRLENELPALQTNFLTGMQRLMDDPRHPLKPSMVRPELARRRMQEVAVITIDPLTQILKDFNQTGDSGFIAGEFSFTRNTASLYYDRPGITPNKKSHHDIIYNHEMWHVISGRGLERTTDGFKSSKVGLTYLNPKSFEGNHWIDEAVTETLTQDTTYEGRNYVQGSYLPYREIYQALIKKIPEELVLKAYFHNMQGSVGRDTWNNPITELEKTVIQVYGADIISKITGLLHSDDPAEIIDRFDEEGNFKF